MMPRRNYLSKRKVVSETYPLGGGGKSGATR